MSRQETMAYYDRFSAGYERRRHGGYHAFLDDMEAGFVKEFARGRVLEVGCGTGLIMERVSGFAGVIGVDLSLDMLRQAAGRGHRVAQGDAAALPFKDAAFDAVCSFKVLAHVPEIEAAIAEMRRVTRDGGVLILEFYNPRSLRGLIKRLKLPTRTSDRFTDEDVYTRYDTLPEIAAMLGPGLELEAVRGVRVFTPHEMVFRVPGLRSLFAALERATARSGLNRYAGFITVALRKKETVRDG